MTAMNDQPGYLLVSEVAVIMRVSKMTVYRLIHEHELDAVRVGRSFRVHEDAVRAYLGGAAAVPRPPAAPEAPEPDPGTTVPGTSLMIILASAEGISGPLARAVGAAAGTPPGDARPPDYRRPGDVRACLRLIARLGRIRVEQDAGVLEHAETAWKDFLPGRRRADPFAGDALSVIDWHPQNIAISEGEAYVRRWARPMLAAGFVDPACLALDAIAAGMPAPAAEDVIAGGNPAFARIAPEHLSRFIWARQAEHRDQDGARAKSLALAAGRWNRHRQNLGLRAITGTGRTA